MIKAEDLIVKKLEKSLIICINSDNGATIASIINNEVSDIIYNVEFEKSLEIDSIDYIYVVCRNFDSYFIETEIKLDLYYLQNGYIGNSINWHRLGKAGYTSDITKAHKFTFEEITKYISNSEKEVAWECDYIDNNTKAIITTIDSQYLDDSTKSIKQIL